MAGVLSLKDKIILFPLWFLTLFPLRVLYFFSDILFLLVFYLVGYRKNVVIQNIKNSFPEKSTREVNDITKKFFRYLCDYFIESIYMINLSIEECNRRYTYKNAELLEKYTKEEKSFIFTTCHYGNWEWTANLTPNLPHKVYAIYKPLSNHVFDRLFIYTRAKFGPNPIPNKQIIRVIVDDLKKKEIFALYLISDQRPFIDELDYWTIFLNQETPVITGTEKLAKKFDLPIVFLDVDRIRRGYYEVTLREITDQPLKTKPNEITEKYIKMVEEMIIRKPEFWLWSHKRWKYNSDQYKPKSIK
jgi:Kdo2-lipid IVA lauroyltransferase/acyltransferase